MILKSFLLVFLDLMLVRSDFNSRAFEIWAAHRRCSLLLQLTKQKAFLSKKTFLDRVKKRCCLDSYWILIHLDLTLTVKQQLCEILKPETIYRWIVRSGRRRRRLDAIWLAVRSGPEILAGFNADFVQIGPVFRTFHYFSKREKRIHELRLSLNDWLCKTTSKVEHEAWFFLPIQAHIPVLTIISSQTLRSKLSQKLSLDRWNYFFFF